MIIQCNNKGCFQHTEATIDKETMEVICTACGNPITNITNYTKRTLIAQGQILNKTIVKDAFQVYCSDCKKNVYVKIENGKGFCPLCKVDLKLSNAFLHSILLMKKDNSKMALEKEEENGE